MGKKKKKSSPAQKSEKKSPEFTNTKHSKDFDNAVKVVIFVAGVALILLFIWLASEVINQTPLKPSGVIYNNPGRHTEEDEIEEIEEEDAEPEDQDNEEE